MNGSGSFQPGTRATGTASDTLAPEIVKPRALNLPNCITITRLVMSFVVLSLIEMGNAWIPCTIVFVVAVWTDYLDGYLARKWNQVTPLGRILDPFVDKIIIGGSLIFLTRLPGSGVTPWLTFAVIGREMFITGLRSVLEAHGVDFSAKWSGKLKMVIQSIALPLCFLSLSHSMQTALGTAFPSFLLLRDIVLWLTLAITLYSGLEYVWRGYLLMKSRPEEARETSEKS